MPSITVTKGPARSAWQRLILNALNKEIFQPLQVVSRYCDPQLQVTDNLCYL